MKKEDYLQERERTTPEVFSAGYDGTESHFPTGTLALLDIDKKGKRAGLC